MDKGIPDKSLRAIPDGRKEEFERLLREFVEIPTVSAEPEHGPDIDRLAELAVATIREFGGKAEILKSPGNPIVHGFFAASRNAPTVTVYNHLDVQPASMHTEPWKTEPFLMVKDGDRYFGRGTTDDKGPALSVLFGVRGAMEAGIPLNIRILWEFEEEIGSPSFAGAVKPRRSRLHTDSVIVSDTIWISRRQPACPAGLRGIQGFRFVLQTAETDQHSGTTGGAARNPLGELMQLVSEIYDARTGKVKIKGFYDDVAPLTPQELDQFRQSGFSVRGFKKAHGFKSIRTEEPMEVMKRLWAQPTFEVHGTLGGYAGTGLKTIVPGRAEVKASVRLVPNQDPSRIAQLVSDFVKERASDVKVYAEEPMFPYRAPVTGPLADAVKAAVKFGFGREPVFVREGGSIGAVVTMEKVFRCPVMFLGLSLPEHGYHAPNENYDWQQASGGMIAFAKYFQLLARMKQ